MKYLYGLAVLCSVIFWSSCRTDFEASPSTGNLEFSRDTVYLDTVFTDIGSSTYTIKVYNRSNEDINIPTVALGDGENSNYRLNVDGLAGKMFEDIQILANDSIFVFIETTIDINDFPNPGNQLLYTDQILFDSGANQQAVELVTLVQDAVFLFPPLDPDGMVSTLTLGMDCEGNDVQVEGFFLESTNLTFTNEKPYVIYGYAAVPSGSTLSVEPGARVHFHENSGILVANGASIKANGGPSTDPELMENQIIFEGDRLEPSFSDVPGQWGTIWLTQGSTDNEFSYATIKNSIVGILMDSNDGDRTLTLQNVEIYNSSNVGLLARNGDVYGENVVINNAGQTALACSLGGRYNFNHSTFANFWTNSFRSFPTVQLDNLSAGCDGSVIVADLIEANFTNCIIYGNERREVAFIQEPSAGFNFNFTNSLIRFEDPNGDFADDPNYDFGNAALYTNCLFNEDPIFLDPALNDFNIQTGTSAADGLGLPGVMPPFDISGTPRSTTAPDAGAYESIDFPD